MSEVSIRPAGTADEDFLFKVYAGTRLTELGGLGWTPEQKEAFIRMQYNARRRAYEAEFPAAVESVLMDGEVPVGSTIVWRSETEMRLVDIALLPPHRAKGLGAQAVAILLGEAAISGLPVRLSVLRGNPAMHLYERLGFVVRKTDSMYVEMEQVADRGADGAAQESDPRVRESQ